MTVAPSSHRPLRADARRNRRRVLDAARAAFEAEGNLAQMEDIAKRAGVGVGTIYRHFPTKQALVDELTAEWMADGATKADDALAEPDPWDGIALFVRRSAEIMLRNRGLREVFGDVGRLFDEEAPVQNHDLHRKVAALLDRAHAAGVLRPDVGVNEFRALMCGLAVAITNTPPDAHQTYADVILTGLRTP
ncbi:TetR/AcrR family transcriptional regulator [Actinomadura violacea]|uniref:Helix-turn-helix transcriptional regulator n=1 Tax=Actinomadura violacea TaxID=2819934 RepID=A0ABS3SAT0_9ACTN|nr:TetR/AcrR family transcriptional regulator [Actinomadura violacea]MBO2466123.1 helix-turn-helix transcriptional regulator [Actinomadura violacea]